MNSKASKSNQTFVERDLSIIKVDFVNDPTFERKEVWAPEPKDIQKAYDKLLVMWNKDQKSRNFVKHLVIAFLPLNTFNKVGSIPTDKKINCAILGYELAGLLDISKGLAKIGMDKVFVDAKAHIENDGKYTKEQQNQLKKIRNSVPIQIRKAMFAYLSDSSDKYLCNASVVALHFFAESMMLHFDDDEIRFSLNKKRFKEANNNFPKKNGKKRFDNKQINNLSKAATFGIKDNLDIKTLSSLEAMKAEMEAEK